MVLRAIQTVLLLTVSSPAAGPGDPGITTKPAGRALSGEVAFPVEELADFSRPQGRQDRSSSTRDEAGFLDAAMRGEAWAQTKVGKSYVTASDDPDRFQQGLDFLRRAAEQNDAEAIYLLAAMTAAGAGVPQSNVEAFLQMKRAAELGFADAQFALGMMYFQGTGTVQDYDAALAAFRRAADAGNVEAMFNAARLLLDRPDAEKQAEGLDMMKRAIGSGHIRATLMLATAYGRGSNGMPKDEAAAEALLKPAAERGDADCQMTLASLYKFGDSFAGRRDEASLWLKRAADQGHPKALEILSSPEMEPPPPLPGAEMLRLGAPAAPME